MDHVRERHLLNREIRSFFYGRDFVEVETPLLVRSPGTDVYIDPIALELETRSGRERRFLHTSPEFAMKRLLADGHDRIFQLCKAFRDSEDTERHSPEFTILEWYRLGDVAHIIDDVEALCRQVLPDETRVSQRRVTLAGPWPRITMQALIESVCEFDILESQSDGTLRDALERSVGLNPRVGDDWDTMFFDMWIRHVDPVLEKMGAVFVTEWPSRLAVLSERDPHDPRKAKRFELYVAGLEIANGFQELTDAEEQRARFEADNRTRISQNRPTLPMPEQFLEMLERGLPTSAGVALGVDRLLMLKTGVDDIRGVLNTET